MLKIESKTANLTTMQNFDGVQKNGYQIRNQEPKLAKNNQLACFFFGHTVVMYISE